MFNGIKLDPPDVRRQLIKAITYEVRQHLCVAHETKRSLRCPTEGESLAIAHAVIRPIEAFLESYKQMQELSLQMAMAQPPPRIVYLGEKKNGSI